MSHTYGYAIGCYEVAPLALHRKGQPTAPGLGIELDASAHANKIEHTWRNRESYAIDDGS